VVRGHVLGLPADALVVRRIGGWFGTGPDRGLALVFTVTGLVGPAVTLVALRTRHNRRLSVRYAGEAA
jgi:DHA3 family multidrug efflux protein-like MFS transporter